MGLTVLRGFLKAAKSLLSPGQVTELRALNVPVGSRGFRATFSGYFDDSDVLAKTAETLSNQGYSPIIFTKIRFLLRPSNS